MSSKSILKNTFTVGIFTAGSRVLGLVREMLQSRLIGAGVEQSAFALAFAIPNMARKLFGEGALTAAFVPVFKGEVEKLGVAEASKLARAVMTMVILILSAVSATSVAALCGVLHFAALSPRAAITIELVAILCPYMVFICGAAFGMGVLNALGKFKASSFMPALLNLFWIATLILLFVFKCPSVKLVALGILLGGFTQMAFMFHSMRKMGVSYLPTFRGWAAENVRLVWRNLGIAALGAGAIQINYALDNVLAQLASPWAAGVIGYAERLMDLPLGVIGVAFGTVLLPTFAGFFANDDINGAREALVSSTKSLLLVMIPAAAGMCALAPEITELIYEGGSFDAQATTRVARALAVYALGLGFFGVQKSLIPWFQAQKDMKTPLRVSVITVCVNAALNILAVVMLPVEWRHVGLASSTVLCAFLGVVILIRFAIQKNGSTGLKALILPVTKMVLASLLMALVLHLFTSTWLIIKIVVGACTYFAFAALFLRQELRSLKSLRRRKK